MRSAWRARIGRGHHLHGVSGTAKGRQRQQDRQNAGFLVPALPESAEPTGYRIGPYAG